MTLSILDIIVFSIGGIIVIIYAYFSIKNLIKFKKAYKKYIDKGMTPPFAKETAMKECYPKKFKKVSKKNTNDNDKIYEE